MEIIFAPKAIDDLDFWRKSGNTKILERIRLLIEDIQRTPFSGIGKPEPLKHQWSGYWSRRITSEHRLVYKIDNNSIFVVQVRYHY